MEDARTAEVVGVLREVYDPEIPVNVYDLGLVYGVDVSDDGRVDVRMTLTSPMCPAAESLPWIVDRKVRELAWVQDVEVDLVWDPPWGPERLSEAARLELGMF